MSDIIETIDGALEDWAVSGDAMRWTPDPPLEEDPPQRAVPRLVHIAEVEDIRAPTAEEISRATDLGPLLSWGSIVFEYELPDPEPGA